MTRYDGDIIAEVEEALLGPLVPGEHVFTVNNMQGMAVLVPAHTHGIIDVVRSNGVLEVDFDGIDGTVLTLKESVRRANW